MTTPSSIISAYDQLATDPSPADAGAILDRLERDLLDAFSAGDLVLQPIGVAVHAELQDQPKLRDDMKHRAVVFMNAVGMKLSPVGNWLGAVVLHAADRGHDMDWHRVWHKLGDENTGPLREKTRPYLAEQVAIGHRFLMTCVSDQTTGRLLGVLGFEAAKYVFEGAPLVPPMVTNAVYTVKRKDPALFWLLKRQSDIALALQYAPPTMGIQ